MADNKKDPIQSRISQQAQAQDQWVISEYLQTLRFTPRLLGVDEADVWKKIEKLCQLYENALTAERGRSAKLARQLKACMARLEETKKAEGDVPDGR